MQITINSTSEICELDGVQCRRWDGKRCTEWLWMNFDAPSRYHDTRFVGSGRRERERIQRRVRTWSEGLRKMPAAERQAVFDACKNVNDQALPR